MVDQNTAVTIAEKQRRGFGFKELIFLPNRVSGGHFFNTWSLCKSC